MVRINFICDLGIAFAVQLSQQLCGGGHSLAGNGIFVFKLLYKFKMLYKGVVFAADLAAHACRAGRGLFAMEVIAVLKFDFVNAVKTPHKIEVPVAAAELAVGNGVITGALLLFDQAGDLFVFHSSKLLAGDLAGLKLGACLF